MTTTYEARGTRTGLRTHAAVVGASRTLCSEVATDFRGLTDRVDCQRCLKARAWTTR